MAAGGFIVRAGSMATGLRLVVATIVLFLAVAGTAPALAHHDSSCAYHDETEFANLPAGCRNFLIDPGVGQALTQRDIAEHPELYGALGIERAFLWYAEKKVVHVRAEDTVTWNHCAYRPGAGNACAPGSVQSSSRTIGESFGGAVDLTVLEYGGSFIGIACGNVSSPTKPKAPAPRIVGAKFLDRDRDGGRDGDEPGMGGWRVELHLVEAFVSGYAPGKVRETTTGPDGRYEFRLNDLPPGRYRVVEESRPGWTQTRQPAEIVVNFGIGDAVIDADASFGNVETTADVTKASFELVDPPAELRADQPTVLTARATLRNDGPADIVDVSETLAVNAPEDCAVEPRRQTVTRRLVEGQAVTVDLSVTVTCRDPSFHAFEFDNDVEVTTPGVTDPDLSDNRWVIEHTIPVIDLANLIVGTLSLLCAARSDVRQSFGCATTVTIGNNGPHPDAVADVLTRLSVPDDCVAASADASRPGLAVSQGAPVTVTSNWTVTCSARSYHSIAAEASAVVNQIHVEEADPADNQATTAEPAIVEIFEPADLAVEDMGIACDEYANPHQFTCRTATTVSNHGPATGVDTRTVVTLAVPSTCTTSGASTHTDDLDAGETVEYLDTFSVTCTDPARHVVHAAAVIAANEPHAEDRAPANDRDAVAWVPTDVKPRSFPSAINLKQKGLIPVAVLSTPTFDAPTAVVPSSLAFGATGTEASWVRCGAAEDVNDDGLLDLVCQFDSTKTGFTCASTVGVLTGRLTDGIAFESQDPVKIEPCN